MMTFTDEYQQRCGEWSDIVDHLPRLKAEVERYRDPTVVELGVRSGNSTCAFLAATETVGGTVWSVDPIRAQVPAHWFDADQWTFVRAVDLDVIDEAPDCDVLFVDTTHAYELTRAELVAYWPKIKPGGVALFHDTELQRPELAAPGDPDYPVRQAIEEWLTGHPELHVEWVEGCNGLAVITGW